MRFGGLTAVKSLNMTVPRHALYGLIGPNGAGKTTVFNVLTGVYCPTEGEIEFDGMRIEKKKPYEITRLGAARTFQNIRLFADMTVLAERHDGAPSAIAAGAGRRRARHRQASQRRDSTRASARWSCSRSSIWTSSPMSRRPACRTAASGGSRLRGRWPPSRSCCCSTSPRPA